MWDSKSGGPKDQNSAMPAPPTPLADIDSFKTDFASAALKFDLFLKSGQRIEALRAYRREVATLGKRGAAIPTDWGTTATQLESELISEALDTFFGHLSNNEYATGIRVLQAEYNEIRAAGTAGRFEPFSWKCLATSILVSNDGQRQKTFRQAELFEEIIQAYEVPRYGKVPDRTYERLFAINKVFEQNGFRDIRDIPIPLLAGLDKEFAPKNFTAVYARLRLGKDFLAVYLNKDLDPQRTLTSDLSLVRNLVAGCEARSLFDVSLEQAATPDNRAGKFGTSRSDAQEGWQKPYNMLMRFYRDQLVLANHPDYPREQVKRDFDQAAQDNPELRGNLLQRVKDRLSGLL